MADHAVITIGVMDAGVLEHAVNMIGKGGNVVVTAVGGEGHTISLHGSPVTGWHKNIQGGCSAAPTRCTTCRGCWDCGARASSSSRS